MDEYDIGFVETLSGFSKQRRRELLLYFTNLPEAIQLKVMDDQLVLARANKTHNVPGKRAEFVFSMYLRAISKTMNIEKFPKQKKTLSDLEMQQLRKIKATRIKNRHIKVPAGFRRLIEEKYMGLINELRTEGLGWRKISMYMAQYHKVTISHSYLQQVYNNLTKDADKTETSK